MSWINPAGGDWNTASNWSSGAVPGASDDVVINLAGQNQFTVTHAANVAESVHSLASYDKLLFSAGSLTLATNSAINADLEADAGTSLNFEGVFNLAASASLSADRVEFTGAAAKLAGAYRAAYTSLSSSQVSLAGATDLAGGTLGMSSSTLDLSAAALQTPLDFQYLDMESNSGLTTAAGVDVHVAGQFTAYGGSAALAVGGTVYLDGPSNIKANVYLDHSLVNNGQAVLNGRIEAGPGVTVTNGPGASLSLLGGFVEGGASLVNQGALADLGGDSRLYGPFTNAATGTVDVQAGTLRLYGGGTSSGAIRVEAGSTLEFAGLFTLTPSSSIGGANLAFDSGCILNVQVAGPTPGTGFTQINATGSVSLAGQLQLSLLNGFTPRRGEAFPIINTDGVGIVYGTFAGLPEGALLAAGTDQMQITYLGDGRNDVVLTDVTNHPPTANVGGPYSTTFGSGVTLDASASTDPDGDPLTYSWTINGLAGAATGVSPTLSWATLANLGLVPGRSYTVSVTAADGYGGMGTSTTTTLTINKADAAVSISPYSGTYDGQAHGLRGTATGVLGEDLSSLLSLGASFTNVPGGTANWSFAGNADYNAAIGSGTVHIAQAKPAFGAMGTTVITDGTPSVKLSGTISDGSLIPTGSVTVTLDGISKAATIAADGSFSVTFATGSLSVGAHTLDFNYGGDANFTDASASGTLDDTYAVLALFDQTHAKHPDSTLPIQIALNTAGGQDVSSSSVVVTALGIAATSDTADKVGATAANVGTLAPITAAGNSNPNNIFREQGGSNPFYMYNMKIPAGLAAGTYRLYFSVAGDPLVHWVTFTVG